MSGVEKQDISAVNVLLDDVYFIVDRTRDEVPELEPIRQAITGIEGQAVYQSAVKEIPQRISVFFRSGVDDSAYSMGVLLEEGKSLSVSSFDVKVTTSGTSTADYEITVHVLCHVSTERTNYVHVFSGRGISDLLIAMDGGAAIDSIRVQSSTDDESLMLEITLPNEGVSHDQ